MIDILLSTYNGAAYISAQLDSIIQQDYTDWQLTVRDDGSTDNTMAILQDYAKRYPSIHIDSSETAHLGCLRSFEYLLKKSNGDYVMLADQDDVWLKDKITRTLQTMLHAEAQFGTSAPLLVYTDLRPVDSELHVLDNSFWHYARIKPELLETPRRSAVNNCVSGCTTMMNQSALACVTPFGKQAYVHDAVMALKVLKNGGHLIRLNEQTILYRLHNSNTIGGAKVEINVSYIAYKIRTCKQVIARNVRDYRQAHEVIGIRPISFIIHRIMYLLKR
ncbi:MAG: glycosyltransferase [Paludibacteraceae bacterium]|nr:glycosyltransferase [Paludibacteraceae bacterium]